jgi:hypothetical protein
MAMIPEPLNASGALMITLLRRLALVLSAYLAASVITGYAVYGFDIVCFRVLPGPRTVQLTGGLTLAIFIALFASAPAGVVIALGEVFTWRNPVLYAATGSMIGLALGVVFSPPRWLPIFGLCFGPVSGLIYWGIAGRTAGLAETWQRHLLAAIALLPVALAIATFASAAMRGFRG